jgi:hypothetical protein
VPANDDLAVPGGQPDLLGDLRSLLHQPHPFEFLAEASSIVAAFDERSRHPFGQADDDVELPSVKEIIDLLSAANLPESVALVAAFAHLAVDEADRHHAERALDLRQRRHLPSWLGALDQTEVDDALAMSDVLGDATNLMVGLRLPGGHPLTAVVLINHLDGHCATDGFALPDTLASVRRSFEDPDILDELPYHGITFDTLDPLDAAAKLAESISLGASLFPAPETDTWPAARPLIEWVARLIGPGGSSGFEWHEWSEDERDEAISAFLASEHGRAHAGTDAESLVDPILWFGTGYGHADPFRWSPSRIEHFLCDFVPRKIIDTPEVLAGFPPLLRSFIRFGHARIGIDPTITDEVLGAMEIIEPSFRAILANLDDNDGGAGNRFLAGLGAALFGSGPDDGGYFDLLDDDLGLLDDDLTYDQLRREMVGRAVGADNVDSIDDEPLPDEDLRWEGIDESIRERVGIIAGHIDRCCDALLTPEYRTACRRLLARAAAGKPDIFRRKSRDDYAAIAIIWSIGQANGLFDNWLRAVPGEPNLLVKELNAFFDVTSPNASQRAATLLAAAGLPAVPGDGLGDPSLLTASRRRSLAAYRDGLPFTA